MKTLAWFTALGLVALSSTSLGLDKERASTNPSKWKLQVDLIDGSRIVGDPSEKTLKLDVGFSELTIPLEQVRRAQWNRSHKSVRVELANHTQSPMFLGRNPSGYNWSGKMDELVIYSRALEPAEIERLYRAGVAK